MTRYDEDIEDRYEDEEKFIELPDTSLDHPAACWICGKPDCKRACFRCGFPVCYNEQSYFEDSTCGAWTLDTWHDAHPEGNTFYCSVCLHAGLIPAEGLTIARITFKADNGKLQIVVGGTPRELSKEEAADLIAYLFDQRGDLFGKPYEEEPEQEQEQEHAPELVTVSSETSDQGGQQDDSLGSIEDHPF